VIPMLILTLVSMAFLVVLIMIAAGYYKEPVLRCFERYAELDDSFYLLPLLLLGMGTFTIFGGLLFSLAVAPRFPAVAIGIGILLLAYIAHSHKDIMRAHSQIFLALPRWYVELRERTTREERRRIAYMWLCLPPRMRLHLNGSDYHFLLWADQVILGTVTQTVEDQEAALENRSYIPDLHGRYG